MQLFKALINPQMWLCRDWANTDGSRVSFNLDSLFHTLRSWEIVDLFLHRLRFKHCHTLGSIALLISCSQVSHDRHFSKRLDAKAKAQEHMHTTCHTQGDEANRCHHSDTQKNEDATPGSHEEGTGALLIPPGLGSVTHSSESEARKKPSHSTTFTCRVMEKAMAKQSIRFATVDEILFSRFKTLDA